MEPEYAQPSGGPVLENLAHITIESEGTPAHILAHEFGHVVDLFATPYAIDAGLACTDAPGCAPSCQLDTSEEAPTLSETLAQLLAIAATIDLYPAATSDNIDAFATDVSCNLGTEIYEEVNAVLCHHDLRACDAGPPAICEACGNGVREGAEACDGSDLRGASCEALGFGGGVLACDVSCMIDTAMCEAAETGLDATGAADPEPNAEVTGVETSLGGTTSTGAGSSSSGGGCECSAGGARGEDLVLAGLGLFGLVGPRRGVAGVPASPCWRPSSPVRARRGAATP